MQSLYTTPDILSANAPKQNTFAIDSSSMSLMRLGSDNIGTLSSSFSFRYTSPGIVTSGTLCGVRRMCVVSLGVVLRIPLRGLFICPFAVAGLATRYLRTVIVSKCGAPSRKPALIALTIGDSQLCFLRCDDISDEDTTMCLLDEGDHRSP